MENKYMLVTLVCEIPPSRYKTWSEGADTIFHGPPADFHNPEEGIWVVDCKLTEKFTADSLKNNLFTEEGGI